MLTSYAANEEAQRGPYKTMPHFSIPDAFYSVHDFHPKVYLDVFKVKDPKTKLSHSAKLSAALLVIAADHATYEKYHQSYGVNLRSPLMILLQRNFPGLDKVKPSHDVDQNELPIRDIGAFFRAWLKKDLSEELQLQRIKKTQE